MKKTAQLQKFARTALTLALAAVMLAGGAMEIGAGAYSFKPASGGLTGKGWGQSSPAAEAPAEPQNEPQNTPQEEPEINNISSTYITDGGEYTLAVGDALTLYHPRTPTSPYYAYTWCPTQGAELVQLDGDQGTCQVIGLAEGDLVLECCLDYTVLYGYSSDHYTYNYIITIHIIDESHSGENDYGTMSGTTCPRCHGDKKVELGGVEITCTTCGGSGIWP